MLQTKYQCNKCGWEAPEGYDSMICLCGGDMRGEAPGFVGSRESFGLGRNFIHTNEDGSKKEITNWKQWEKAGYKDALSCTKNHNVREMIKEKMEKIKKKGGKSIL